MQRFRRRMLVVFLPISLALIAGCVRSTAQDPSHAREIVATDHVVEPPLLPAEHFNLSESVISESTVFSDAAAENAEKSVPPPQPTLSPSPNYIVGNGETLWSIAARSNIYADALLWPLLYQANRDQIRDPRQIYPGQTLSIPRNASEAQKEEAREVARRSKIFPSNLNPLPSN